MLDVRGEIVPRMDLMFLGFQGGDASRLIRRSRWDGTEMLDLRGEEFSRMDPMFLGFQGGGEWRGSELTHSVTRHPRTVMVYDPCSKA